MNAQAANRETTSRGYIPALDGMRGLAILLVLSCHLSERFQCDSVLWRSIRNVTFGGWTGVDLFFVLSGFLITGILWDTKDAPHYFRSFYARRTLRIVPLNYAALFVLMFILPAVVAPLVAQIPMHLRGGVQGVVHELATARPYSPLYVLYLVNALVAWDGFGIALTHLWSLSVEEHFYLVWPILVYRLTLRRLMITSAILVGVALLLRIIALPLCNELAIYVLTPFRMDGLALGALIALLWRIPEQQLRVKYWAKFVLPVAGLILFGMLAFKRHLNMFGPLTQTIGYSVSVAFYGSLLVRSLDVAWLGWIFRQRFFRFFGKYSYSIYIFHVIPLYMVIPVFALGDQNHFSFAARALEVVFRRPDYSISGLPMSRTTLWVDGMVFTLVVVGTSAVIAMITWRVLEAPCLRLKRFFAYEEPDRLVEGKEIVADLVRH